jgi:hypothetical protein
MGLFFTNVFYNVENYPKFNVYTVVAYGFRFLDNLDYDFMILKKTDRWVAA